MRRDHPTSPFDFEADELQGELDDVTEQFWGATRSWVSREHPATEPGQHAERGDRATGSMAAIKGGIAAFRPTVRGDASGEIARTRQHGVVQPPAATREATLGELASGWFDDDDDWSLPTASHTAVSRAADPQPDDSRRTTGSARAIRRDRGPARDELIPLSDRPAVGLGAVDPLLVRLGAIVAAIVMLVPLAMSLRPAEADAIESIPGVDAPAGAAPVAGAEGDDESVVEQQNGTDTDQSPQAAVETESSTETEARASTDGSATAPASGEAQDAAPAAAPATEPAAESTEQSIAAVTQSESAVDDGATVDAVAERQVPECPQTYAAGAGDSWYRIADAAGVTPSALLDENGATLDSVIFPGDEICLPAGATMPSPPTTTAPATTAPATTAPATTAPPTTAPATTTPATTGEVQQIIRDVFPDELEERALEIAFRESRYVATAYNGWCCYGVFQIYWSVHQGWLDDYGIYSSSDLFDARKNTEAAYALYRAAGGWGPWGG